MSGYSKEAEASISAKMHKMKDEDRPQAQKVAIALSEARKKGFQVPAALKAREKRVKKGD